ncbi:bifunctional [glutamine synthetase] adenylyltransferase/[glutamine synthetase]-adenylyl-L-tyrosine phosphorylase [uncultured Sphingomonas sp.]|mgnify:CR=1 FL=1|uniref:bifunctional [glutamine synthetase] adenylyltransferase/[glutamine synthetase]-adenylyl-L-tyrosine phosphorylase n=1 Tax=uncultured Sphingomonas sp. TaxID=158754 RepID=UPI0025FADBA1|nr:bifunctional [glutamine synthetase] adenylyltransferase/[glutamine synthetase]-adenylyl-L-tyrosine phosphorylase [uncultured Sphingomonas sp.]
MIDLHRAIALADAESPFLRGLMRKRPEVVEALHARGLAATLAALPPADPANPDFMAALRRERQSVALAIALADLGGLPFEAATRALSDFADHALDRAIRAAMLERMPDEPPRGMVALALGKQGSHELNYSSDIDPILLFDPATLPHRAREEPVEAAVRIARRVVALLQEPTADGYVLRVDLRLRPASEATPLAVPIDAAIQHYESSALPWERAAFIRARAAAGDLPLGRQFLDHIRPFVWRRALDYGTIAEIRGLSRRIRSHHTQGQRPGPGFDVKRGRGGIREIEFFAQIHQLIHGGRMPALRAPATLDALQALAAAGLIPPDEAERLGNAYRFLRTIEHRLQMVGDQQTHRLPVEPAARDAAARLAGYADGDALIAAIAPVVEHVGALYDSLDPDPAPSGQVGEDLFAGFAEPARARARIAAWREGRVRTTRSEAARTALEAVLPALLRALAVAPAPDAALARFDDLVERLPSAVNLFRLLEARPGLLDQLAAILSHAPALAGELSRRAMLLDGLIDASALDPAPSVEALCHAFAAGEQGDDYQALLDRVRARVSERRFQLGVQLVTGSAAPLAVGAGYGRVAQAAVEVMAGAAIAEFAAAHGRVPGGELVILALGRMGGGVLTHASDLDLVYLFTGDFLAESDGARPLGATTYFNRLGQRVTAALSVQTASGPLYPVDTRLRPSGGQGLLAVSVDSFARYQAESAWTWEHMALARARPIFGSPVARGAVQAVIDDVLARPRDHTVLVADAVKMRGEVALHKPPAGPLDVKLIEGGLVDAEFAIHLLQLAHTVGLDPRLDHAATALEQAGLVRPGFGAAVDLLTAMLIALRLVAPDSAEPPVASQSLLAELCGTDGWADLLARYQAARSLIVSEWRRVAGLG